MPIEGHSRVKEGLKKRGEEENTQERKALLKETATTTTTEGQNQISHYRVAHREIVH